MKAVKSIVISMAVAAGLLVPAISQAHVDVNVSLGLPLLQIAATPVVVEAAPVVVEAAPVEVEPVPVMVGPSRVHYVEGPRFAPGPQPVGHRDFGRRDHDDHDHR